MARVFIDGFESGGIELWDNSLNGPAAITARTNHSGAYCCFIETFESLSKMLPLDDEYYFSFKYEVSEVGGANILSVWNSSNHLVSIARSDLLFIYASSGGSTLATATSGQLSVGSVSLIEIRIKIHDSSGVVQVKMNGNLVIDYSGDTKPGSDTQIGSFSIGYTGSSVGVYGRCYIDDLVVDNASWIGGAVIQGIFPSGAGTTTEWDPSTGSNYTCVDEKPANDADYISTNTTDEIDLYAAANLSGTIGGIKCVQVQARARSEGTPTPTKIQLAVRSGGTNYFSGSLALPSSFGLGSPFYIWEANPADSAAWEEADVNAIEIGIKAVAS